MKTKATHGREIRSLTHSRSCLMSMFMSMSMSIFFFLSATILNLFLVSVVSSSSDTDGNLAPSAVSSRGLVSSLFSAPTSSPTTSWHIGQPELAFADYGSPPNLIAFYDVGSSYVVGSSGTTEYTTVTPVATVTSPDDCSSPLETATVVRTETGSNPHSVEVEVEFDVGIFAEDDDDANGAVVCLTLELVIAGMAFSQRTALVQINYELDDVNLITVTTLELLEEDPSPVVIPNSFGWFDDVVTFCPCDDNYQCLIHGNFPHVSLTTSYAALYLCLIPNFPNQYDIVNWNLLLTNPDKDPPAVYEPVVRGENGPVPDGITILSKSPDGHTDRARVMVVTHLLLNDGSTSSVEVSGTAKVASTKNNKENLLWKENEEVPYHFKISIAYDDGKEEEDNGDTPSSSSSGWFQIFASFLEFLQEIFSTVINFRI